MLRFVVCCPSRTGASLLVDAIRQHSDALALDELFMPDAEKRLRLCAIEGRAYRDGEDGPTFLRDWVYLDRGYVAVGFKLMHYDGRWGDEEVARARTYLAGDRDVAVIHLVRDNLLARLVSNEVAERSAVWSVAAEGGPTAHVPPFRIEAERCRINFENTLRWADETRTLFGGHPYLELEYERDIEGDFDAAMAKVWAFLALSPWPFRKRLRKQGRRDLREQVSNFDELAAHFSGGPYARHFVLRDAK